jgi:hypothetical protein
MSSKDVKEKTLTYSKQVSLSNIPIPKTRLVLHTISYAQHLKMHSTIYAIFGVKFWRLGRGVSYHM